MKVVLDTNIFISAFVIPGGKAEAAYSHALRKDFTLYSSVAILTEMAQKLREKFGWQQDKITSLLKAIAKDYEQIADQEAKNKSQLFRDMFSLYREKALEREFFDLQRYGAKRAREKGI